MFDSNVTYIKQMEELIIAGQIKHQQLSEQLATMDANPDAYQDYEIADMRDFVNRLDKRLADMKVVRFIMLQSLAQIRVVQNNNTSIAEKAQSIVSTTIPVWKNQLTIAVALHRQKQNVEMQKKISDTTNTILQKNAELLKQNSIDVARENEKTVVSIDTLKRTTQSLIETLNEVKQIHEQGAQNRKTLNTELATLETELKKNVTNRGWYNIDGWTEGKRFKRIGTYTKQAANTGCFFFGRRYLQYLSAQPGNTPAFWAKHGAWY